VVPYDGAQTSYSLSIETEDLADVPSGMVAQSAAPESLALRDSTGLGVGGAASAQFGQPEDKTLAGQLLAAA
jgi:hypothetical protein